MSVEIARPGVFVSYSHRDKAVLTDLLPYLDSLQREGAASVWTDGQIKAGERWRDEIDDALNSARVAVLLISQEFLASPFVREEELPRILRRQAEGQLAVLPVFVSPSTVESACIAVADATGQVRLITLSDFQGFGTPDETLSELQLPERQRRFVALHNRIRELAHPAPLSTVRTPTGINASSPSMMSVEQSGEAAGDTVVPATSYKVANPHELAQTQPSPKSLIQSVPVKLLLLLALVVSAGLMAWTLAFYSSNHSRRPVRSLQDDLKSLAMLARAKRLKELRGESQSSVDQNPAWNVDPSRLSGAARYCYTYLSNVDTNVLNCLFDRSKFPVHDLIEELKRAIPELELLRGAPNKVVYVNDTPYSDWLTFGASGIEINVSRSIAKPNDISLSVYEIR